MLFAGEQDADEPSRVGKYASSASSAVGKAAKRTQPILAKVGSALLAGLKKLWELARKGLGIASAAVKSRSGNNEETTPPEASSPDEEPVDES